MPWMTHDLTGSCGLCCKSILSTLGNPLFFHLTTCKFWQGGLYLWIFYCCILVFAKQTRNKTNQNLSVHNYSSTTTLPHNHHPKSGLCTLTCCSSSSIRFLQVCHHNLSPSNHWNISIFFTFFRECCLCSTIVESSQIFAVGLKSGLWLGYSRTFNFFFS